MRILLVLLLALCAGACAADVSSEDEIFGSDGADQIGESIGDDDLTK